MRPEDLKLCWCGALIPTVFACLLCLSGGASEDATGLKKKLHAAEALLAEKDEQLDKFKGTVRCRENLTAVPLYSAPALSCDGVVALGDVYCSGDLALFCFAVPG